MSNVEAARHGKLAQLLMVTAAVESGAGLALLVAPAAIIRLSFGAAVEPSPAVGIARLTGVALLSLCAACWWARDDAPGAASRAVVKAMLIYNAGVLTLILFGGLGALGLIQWGAVVMHGALGIWCARSIR